MQRFLIVLSAAVLSACAASSAVKPASSSSAGARPAASLAATAAAPATASTAALKSGLDLAGFDLSARPQDDLFRFAAGGWLARTEIPADRSNFGTFAVLEDNARAALREQICRQSLSARHGFASFAETLGMSPGERDADPISEAIMRLDYDEALALLDARYAALTERRIERPA